MTEEEKALKEAQRLEDAKAVNDDIVKMDNIIHGIEPEPVPIVEEEVVLDGTQDDVVAVGEPDKDIIEEPKIVDNGTIADDDYDFTTFINAMAKDALAKPQAVVQPTVVQAQPQTVEVAIPPDLVTLEEMQKAFESPEEMITLMGKIYLRARVDGANDGSQRALVQFPTVVRPVVAQEAELAELARTFYSQNPELNSYRDFVQYCAVQIESAHPDWTPRQVMAETAKVANKRLPMLKEAAQRQGRAPSTPSFVEGQSQKPKNVPSKVKLTALEQEIAAMPSKF